MSEQEKGAGKSGPAEGGGKGGSGGGDGGEKTTSIIVNGRPREVAGKDVTFDQIVHLAFDNPPYGADTIFSVTYRKGGNEHRPDGIMVEGDTVKVKKGTTFNVSATNRS